MALFGRLFFLGLAILLARGLMQGFDFSRSNRGSNPPVFYNANRLTTFSELLAAHHRSRKQDEAQTSISVLDSSSDGWRKRANLVV
jgi:hypothetical protein